MSNRLRPNPPHVHGEDPYRGQEYAQVEVIGLPMERRLAFIRKVYSIFGVAMAAWVGMSYLILTNINLLRIAVQPPVFYGSMALWVISGWVGPGLIRKFGQPAGAAYLGVLVTAASILTGAMMAAYLATAGATVILNAFILTCVIFGGLTAYAFISRTDFKPWGGFLFVATLGVFAIGLLQIFLPMPGISHYLSYVVVFLFSGWVLYDTSNILHHYQEDEVFTASASIFVDFVIIFWNLTSILSGRD